VRVSLVEALRGQAGHLRLTRITVNALEQEDHLVFVGVSDSGASLDAETCEKLFGVAARVATNCEIPSPAGAALEARLVVERDNLLDRIGARNTRFFEEEIEKLERWADDLKNGLEREVKDLDAEIRTAKRDAKLEASLDAKVAAQRRIRELEAERNRKRRTLFEAQDEVDRRKEDLITGVEARLRQTVEAEPLFTIRWRVI
jgi:adenine-specific DNA-methyltransferase